MPRPRPKSWIFVDHVVQTDGVSSTCSSSIRDWSASMRKRAKSCGATRALSRQLPTSPRRSVPRKSFMARRSKAAAASCNSSATGSGVEAAEVYAGAKLPTAIGGSVEVNGYLYGTGSDALMCVEVPKRGRKVAVARRRRWLVLLCRWHALRTCRETGRAKWRSWRRRPRNIASMAGSLRRTAPDGRKAITRQKEKRRTPKAGPGPIPSLPTAAYTSATGIASGATT